MRVIQLTRGQHTIVDDHVFEWASKFKWYALKRAHTWYAVRSIRLANGKRTTVCLHREILNAPAGVEVDHKDGDGLNNFDENIRLCSRSENEANKRKRRDNTSGYVGVSWRAQEGKWRARVASAGRESHLGYFDTAAEAARARDKSAIELHGEFARLNFPQL